MNKVKVYIVLLNYKNWEDTVECLLSLNNLKEAFFEVVVVDNASGNESLVAIKSSLAGVKLNYKINYLQAEHNGGFAKGNNIGINFALERGDGSYVWVLNNDTTVDEYSLKFLIEKAFGNFQSGLKIGVYGSKLRYYSQPEVLQAMGGRYNKCLGTIKEIGNLELDKGQFDHCNDVNVVIGAAMFLPSECLVDVGLLSEEYFIYFEEIDLVEKAKKMGWGVACVPESVVYHKQGMATNANGLDNLNKSKLSDFFYFRNRLKVTYKFYPFYLPTVYLSYIFTAINRIRRGQWRRLWMLFKVLFRFRTIQWV